MILRDDGFADIQTVVVELNDLLAVHADKVSMPWCVREVWVVLRGLLSQAHLPNETCANEKGEGAVNGGAGDFIIAAAAAGKKGLGGEVLLGLKNHFGDKPPLGREAESLGAHAFKRPLLGAWFLRPDFQSAPFSGPSSAPRLLGPFSALRNRFTAGLTTREARETTPRGRVISAP